MYVTYLLCEMRCPSETWIIIIKNLFCFLSAEKEGLHFLIFFSIYPWPHEWIFICLRWAWSQINFSKENVAFLMQKPSWNAYEISKKIWTVIAFGIAHTCTPSILNIFKKHKNYKFSWKKRIRVVFAAWPCKLSSLMDKAKKKLPH